MPDCLCGHPFRQHREGGACTRCPACAIFEPNEPDTDRRPFEPVSFPALPGESRRTPGNPGLHEAEVLAGLEGMRREADRPLLGGVPYRLTEQTPLWEPEPPEFPMEMPHDDRDASEIPHSHEPDPWWLDA